MPEQVSLFENTETAWFSHCRKYRYTLWRQWDQAKPFVQFIGLNPSTATETVNDPTVRRCIRFAKSWGYGGMCMTNIFAYRATDPADMKRAEDPVGNENDRALKKIYCFAGRTVCCWGVHGEHLNRGNLVREMLGGGLYCLGKTKGGHPKHPLYLKKDLRPVLFFD